MAQTKSRLGASNNLVASSSGIMECWNNGLFPNLPIFHHSCSITFSLASAYILFAPFWFWCGFCGQNNISPSPSLRACNTNASSLYCRMGNIPLPLLWVFGESMMIKAAKKKRILWRVIVSCFAGKQYYKT